MINALQLERILYIGAAAFQLAAIVFALLMLRFENKPRPWQILFVALLIMFVFRIIGVYTGQGAYAASLRPLNAAAAMTISILIFAALFSIRKLAVAERMGQGIYRAVGESIDYGIWICDGEGHNTYASPSFLKLIGMTQKRFSEADWTKILHPDDAEKSIAAWQECVRAGDVWYREHRFKGTDGLWHPILACGLPVRGANGKITHWAGINLDIHRLKEAEDRERAARMAAEHQSRLKDEFLATLSHELRTPLNAIVGWAELMRTHGDDAETVREGIEVIHRNAFAQTRLIEDLLDMSRILSGKVRLDIQQIYPASFVEAAIRSAEPAANAKGIRIEKVLDSTAGPVSGDPNRLQQVIWNLLANAIKFTPKGGKVQLRLQRVASHVEITVSDTGEGIASDFLPFVFERFRQADSSRTRPHPGLGLGLALVKDLVELHGGQVRASSAGQGLGATFAVLLPLRVAADSWDSGQPVDGAPETKSPAERVGAELSGVQVLVVDDDADARDLIGRLLRDCNANVSLAASAADARALIKQSKPDVIVSDIGMPGQDGYQFMQDLRKDGITIPAIALTAFARSEDRQRALLSGYQMHLAKPVQPAELITVVGSVAGRLGLRR